MLRRDWRDVVGGLLLIVMGLAYSHHAYTNYAMGSLRKLGPGAFPAGLGLILAGFGLVLAIQALMRSGENVQIAWRPLLFVQGSIAFFALTVKPFGLLPSVIALVCLASFAERNTRLRSIAILALVLCLLVWVVFGIGLALPVPMWRWPF